MFAYCNNNPSCFKDITGKKMAGILSGPDYYFGGSGWSSTAAQTVSAIQNPIAPDTKENVKKRVSKDIQDVVTFFTTSPYIQKPLGAKSLYNGCTTISEGVALILTPWPTLNDEILGIVKIFWGFKEVIESIDQIF